MKFFETYVDKIKYFLNKIYIDSYVRKYIAFNKKKWKSYKIRDPKGIILLDLFDHYPFIYFWSYIANVVAKKHNLEIKYFYFYFYKSRFEKSFLYLRKIKKIFESFNATKGIDENDFKNITFKFKEQLNKKFNKLKNKKKFIEYKYRDILIGDLIYDTYLRNTFKPTINFDDTHLFDLFIRAHKIFDQIENFMKVNNVKLVIPSHAHYIQFGIITRIALKNKIKVFKIFETNQGNSNLRIRNILPDFPKERERYFEYKKNFFKLKNKNKLKQIGKSILLRRLTGKKDNSLPYMKNNTYGKFFENSSTEKLEVKNKIIIFTHCFFDSPHKHRKMLFEDFYEQLNFILSLSKYNKKYNWFIKPHPASFFQNDEVLKKLLLKDYSNVTLLHKNTSNAHIANSKPKLIITDHGTIAHEMAYFGIPVLNTGDNPHINYNFNLHANSRNHIKNILNKLPRFIKKLNFNQKDIFEFVYMHYVFSMNSENEKKYIKDSFFGKGDSKLNSKNSILNYLIKQDLKNSKKIYTYINKFISNKFK
jgi:hypothetical protein